MRKKLWPTYLWTNVIMLPGVCVCHRQYLSPLFFIAQCAVRMISARVLDTARVLDSAHLG